jgi:hypothetical protein
MTPEKANEMNKERALEIGNDSAFPNQDSNGFLHYGLSTREWMATQIMAGLIAPLRYMLPPIFRTES